MPHFDPTLAGECGILDDHTNQHKDLASYTQVDAVLNALDVAQSRAVRHDWELQTQINLYKFCKSFIGTHKGRSVRCGKNSIYNNLHCREHILFTLRPGCIALLNKLSVSWS